MLELKKRNSSGKNSKFNQKVRYNLDFIDKKNLQIKSRLAVESMLLSDTLENFRFFANSERSMLKGFPAIAPLIKFK